MESSPRCQRLQHHNQTRVLIGPPIDFWYKTESWSILKPAINASSQGESSSRKASANDIANSVAKFKPRNKSKSDHLNVSFQTDAPSNSLATTSNDLSNSFISEDIISTNGGTEANTNHLLSESSDNLDLNPGLPMFCRALVRLELVKGWCGPPGSYHYNLLDGCERKSFSMREFGLILFHNRLELTMDQDRVDNIIYFYENTKLSLFSTVDYSIAISQENENDVFTSVYILTFPSTSLAKSWYMVLHKTMLAVPPIPDKVTVVLPELDTKVEVSITDPDMDVWKLRDVVLDGLIGEEDCELTLNTWKSQNSAGVAWKHLDRLEWVSPTPQLFSIDSAVITPQFIESTHELQIRTMVHCDLTDSDIHDTAPVEGYLIFRGYRILESGKDQPLSHSLKKGRAYYLSTFNQHFTLVSAKKFSKRTRTSKQPLDSIPFSHIESADRPGFSGGRKNRITKTNPNIRSDLDLWRHLEGFVDFREVTKVQPIQLASGNADPLFEIELYGGRRLRFEAWNLETMQEWARRLQTLVQFWKVQLNAEINQEVTFAKHNAERVREDAHPEACDNFQVENSRVLANSKLWKVCYPSNCFPILKSGVLYAKDHLHTTFKKYHVVLTLDALHFFESSVATYHLSQSSDHSDLMENQHPVDTTRLPSPSKSLHPRITDRSVFTLPLKNCFAYTGFVLDQLGDVGDPNPHIFPDQLVTQDSELDRQFGVWQSHLAYLWVDLEKSVHNRNQGNKLTRFLGFLNRTLQCHHFILWPWLWFQPNKQGACSKWIFQARSKLERDHWVYLIGIAVQYWISNKRWAR